MSEKGPSAWRIQQAVRIWHERAQQGLAEADETSGEAAHEVAAIDGQDIAAMQTWLVRAVRHAEAMQAGIKRERADLLIREKRFAAREENLRNTLGAIVEITTDPSKKGTRTVELPIATLTLGAGKTKIDISDGCEKNIPDAFYEEVEYVKVRKGLLKDKLIASLTTEKTDPDTGEVLPPPTFEGVRLSNAAPQLSIRSK
jgi:hypothetical protein